jgi:hypothetical protein
MATAPIDGNSRQGLIAESSAGDGTIVRLWADPVTHRLLVDLAGGSGTVTSVSVATANGFAGTVADPTTTPAITLSTTITGILQGNGTAISAITVGSGLTFAAGTLSVNVPSTITVANEATDTTCFVGFFTAATGDLQPKTNAHLTFDAANNVLHTHALAGDATDGLIIESANGTDVALFGPANTANATFYGATAFTGAVLPVADNTPALGASGQAWADLFLGSGAVINFNAGNYTLTHSADILTANKDFRITTVGTDSASVPTLGSTSTLTNKTLTSPAINAPTTTYTVEPGADDTAYGDVLAGILAGDTIAQWDLVYLDSTSGRWEKADADAATTAGGVLVGLAMAAGTDGNALSVLVRGIVRNDGWTWTGAGKTLYPSTTAAAMTETAPSGTDDVVRVLGYTLSDDCVWFDPAKTWITHV